MNRKTISKFMTEHDELKLKQMIKVGEIHLYGFYWFCIDQLIQSPDYKMKTDDPKLVEMVNKNEHVFEHMFSNRTHVQSESNMCSIETNMCSFLLNTCSISYKLFTIKNGFFWSESLRNHMIQTAEKRAKAGEKSGESRRIKAKLKNSSEENRTHVQPELTLELDAEIAAQSDEHMFDLINSDKNGTYIVHNNSTYNKKNIGVIGEKNSKLKKSGSSKSLFRNSSVFDLNVFKSAYAGTNYEKYDLEYYHELLLNWSDSGANKKVDWIATGRNFMLSDESKGKAKIKINSNNTINSKFHGKD